MSRTGPVYSFVALLDHAHDELEFNRGVEVVGVARYHDDVSAQLRPEVRIGLDVLFEKALEATRLALTVLIHSYLGRLGVVIEQSLDD